MKTYSIEPVLINNLKMWRLNIKNNGKVVEQATFYFLFSALRAKRHLEQKEIQ